MRPAFDLQSHSTCSDGALPPADVVAAAARDGVELLALTDHDTVAGVDEALAAAAEHGIRLLPAAELSALDGDREDLHVCAYGIDHRSPALHEALERWQADRTMRIHRMREAIGAAGFPIDVPERAVLGRPHLARALTEQHGIDHDEAFRRFLVPGVPTYVRRTTPTVPEVIDAIHAAGGVAVWAHPFWDVGDDGEVLDALDRFAAAGLDGVETFYVTFDERQTRLLHGAALERGLLTTGSSDFHGPQHPRFDRFRAHPTYGLEPHLGSLARP